MRVASRSLPLPFLQQRLVMSLLAACFLVLDFGILSLEPSTFLLCRHRLLDKILRAVLAIDACRIEFSRALNDGACL